MPSLYQSPLPERGVLSVSGPDSRDFLQGLISNDISEVSPEKTIYAALLTPQGKYLFDFFISQIGDKLLIDCEKSRIGDLLKRLRIYKLRANAELADETDHYRVHALWGDDVPEICGLANEPGAATVTTTDDIFLVDPRLAQAGVRALLATNHNDDPLETLDATAATPSDYDLHRLTLGLPDASRDLLIDKSILLESGFDELNGINWNKGCYMGQELTARTKYRGLIKKRLVPVTIDGDAPASGAAVLSGDKNVGEMRSSNANRGLALLRLEALENDSTDLRCEQAALHPIKPGWATY